MNILGISCFYHDSAACLITDGEVIAAAQEERFTRKKHDQAFPVNAVDYCLKEGAIDSSAIDYIAFYDKPFIKFERILQTYLMYAPRGSASFVKSLPTWIRQKLWIPDLITKEIKDFRGKILFPEHHESHAASAFFPSPFNQAAFLVLDGVGEWTTSSYGVGKDSQIEIMAEIPFPHSLGLLYSAFTYYTGFKVNSGEYKVMGLAPYGEPKYVKKIFDNLLDLKENGSFRLNMDYFDYCTGLTMTNARFSALFDGPPRVSESELTQREMDLARSVQEVAEEVIVRMGRHIKNETGQKNLCMAGGVALNCVANGKLLRTGLFDNIWVQPAAGDAGGAVGAAFIAYHHHLKKPSVPKNGRDKQKASYLGPEYSNDEILNFLDKNLLPYTRMERDKLLDVVANLLANGQIVGWFQGRMEFGPRSLGNRSILGDARSPEMQKKMNLKIKFRESFRPFAPSVLSEKAGEWFELESESPYMLLVAGVRKEKLRMMTEEEEKLWGINKLNVVRSEIPAVTHVDYSARVQTVNKADNPMYHALISKFEDITGCPVIVNTSFNVRGEPIVESPSDAYKCFMRTDIDVLVLGDFVLHKEKQPQFNDNIDWKQVYELD